MANEIGGQRSIQNGQFTREELLRRWGSEGGVGKWREVLVVRSAMAGNGKVLEVMKDVEKAIDVFRAR
jgi:hypothetical protein